MAEEPLRTRSRSSSLSSALSSVSELFPLVSVTRSLWRQPQVHDDPEDIDTGGVVKTHVQHRHEEWYELFYDLVFVAAAIQMGSLLKYHLSYSNVFVTTLLFMVMRATWDHLTMYQNRYDTKDLLHHMFYMVESMTAFTMCLSLRMEGHSWDKVSNMAPFAVAAAVARVAQSLMYSQVLAQSDKNAFYIRTEAIGQRLSAVLFISSAIWGETGYDYAYYWIAAVMVERPLVKLATYLLLPLTESTVYRVPQHTSHLIHRQGTFILLILGEAIIQLVQAQHGQSFEDYAKAIMGFGIVFNIGDVYYQQQLVGLYNDIKFRPNYMWSNLHMLLSLLMLFFAVGIKLLFTRSEGDRSYTEECFLCASASGALGIIFLLRMMHKGIRYKGKRIRRAAYVFRFGASALCGFIPMWSSRGSITVLLLFIVTSLIVLQDLFSHRGLKNFVMGDEESLDATGSVKSGSHHEPQASLSSLEYPITQALLGADGSFGRDEYIRERSLSAHITENADSRKIESSANSAHVKTAAYVAPGPKNV